MHDERDQQIDHVFLQKALGWLEGAREESALKALLDDFSGYLRTHFSTEEAPGGFFEMVLEEAPHHTAAVAVLRDQHAAMLEVVVMLSSRLEDRPRDAAPLVLDHVAQLVRDLKDHERREFGLLQSLSRDIGDGS